MGIVCLLLQAYLVALIGRIILSWFPISPGSVMEPVFSALYAVTEPVLGPVRRVVPPLRMGMGGIDLSPIIVIVFFQLLLGAICAD